MSRQRFGLEAAVLNEKKDSSSPMSWEGKFRECFQSAKGKGLRAVREGPFSDEIHLRRAPNLDVLRASLKAFSVKVQPAPGSAPRR